MSKVSIVHNAPPVRCVEVRNGRGERVLDIQPDAVSGGVEIHVTLATLVVLNFDELTDLLRGLSRIEIEQRSALDQLVDG